MKCFKHPEKDAIGMCKACNKGLCADCANDLGHGLACKGEHEEMVETYNMIIERNAKVYTSAPKNILIAPIFYAFMGAVFVWTGLTSRQGVTSFIFILGAGFIVFAIVMYLRNRKLFVSQVDDC